jgi:hypothetical protein
MRVKSPKMDLGLRPPACKKRKIISIFGPVNPARTTKKVVNGNSQRVSLCYYLNIVLK